MICSVDDLQTAFIIYIWRAVRRQGPHAAYTLMAWVSRAIMAFPIQYMALATWKMPAVQAPWRRESQDCVSSSREATEGASSSSGSGSGNGHVRHIAKEVHVGEGR